MAVQAYRKNIESEEWALYRVRRIYSDKGKADGQWKISTSSRTGQGENGLEYALDS